ncbi:Os07g0166300 [Oryza sativa Japonica Group]|uniref:Os07g0166300 protein n=1 Tax=Oryza sativa subsp. japonica TaxID=39947 RepID=A0A0P0X2Z5_ORYSJ|nr:hypothetical protein EE612_037347 [Oryza sativa]BAT00206.1 Os07g0166300 [Oryza sativa Japonica Group]
MGGEKAGSQQEAWQWRAAGRMAHALGTMRPQYGVDGVDLEDDATEPRVRLCRQESPTATPADGSPSLESELLEGAPVDPATENLVE